jgi:uncharacterized protein YndB with AHSA1/START domain
MANSNTLVVKRRFAYPAEAVFDAWLDAKALGAWLFKTPDGVMEKVEVDARVGGLFRVNERRSEVLAEHWGRYVEIDRPLRLAFDFGVGADTEPTTRVTIDIAPNKDGCELTLTHEGVWADYQARTEQGWTMILDNLSRSVGNERERELIITRCFEAPRALVWEAWTKPEHFVRWMGPRGFTTTMPEGHFKVEGSWRYDMIYVDGTIYPNRIVFREITPISRLVYDHGDGGETSEHDFETTVSFEEEGEGTRVTLRSLFVSKAVRDYLVESVGAVEGGKQTLERLGEAVAYMQQEPLIITHEFDAPRQLVFDAFTKAEHLAHWWGPKGCKIVNARIDLKRGGEFRYGMQFGEALSHGKQFYREITPPSRLVYENMFTDETGAPQHPPFDEKWPLRLLTTILFEDVGDRTRVTVLWTPLEATAEERATFEANRANMNGGWSGSFEVLEAYLASI